MKMKEYFYCKSTGNIYISGSFGIASQKWFCPMCIIWPSPWNCDAPITLLMKSCTQMNPPSSLHIILLSLVTFSYLTMRNPLQTKHGNRPSCRDQERRKASVEVVPGTSVSPLVRSVYRGTFGVASRVPSTVLHFKTECETSLETL